MKETSDKKVPLVNMSQDDPLYPCLRNVLFLSKGHLLIEPNVPVPDQPEPSVRHLDAPEARLLQLPGDSGELVSYCVVSENQSESGSNPPNICRERVPEFYTNGPFKLKKSDMKII